MLSRLRNVNAADLVSTTLYQLFDVARNAPYVTFVKPVLRDEDVQLIESRFLAELDQRREIDVTIDDVLHARLRLAHVVYTAADHEWLFDTLRGLHGDSVADVCFRNLESVALDQHFTSGRRPCTALGHEFANAYVAVVFNYKQHQVAPLHWSSLDLPADRAPRFGIAHFGILENRFDEIVID